MISEARRRKYLKEMNKADPVFVEKIMPYLEALYTYYFRCEVQGQEKIKDDKQTLYVANHNGMVTFDVLMLFVSWWKHFGNTHNTLGLAHGLAFTNPILKHIVPKIGAIPADPEIGYEAMKRGHNLIVFPGGLKEAMRPYSERKNIVFSQHKGFIRLALKAGASIRPIVNIGGQETYVILDRGERLAEQLGVKNRLRMAGLPITFRSIFLAWCIGAGLVSFFPLLLVPFALGGALIPLPAKMTFKILDSIDVKNLYNSNLSQEENIQVIYDHVTGAMQEALTDGYRERRLPLVG